MKDILKDDGARTREILSEFKPPFASKDEYLAYIDGLNCSGDRIEYRDDGSAVVKCE